MSNYLRDLRRFVGGVGVAMLLLLVTFVSIPDGEAQANSIISQIGADIDGETANYYSGYSVAMSADGSRVAIGATGADGDPRSSSGHGGGGGPVGPGGPGGGWATTAVLRVMCGCTH
jgi:hypothetical protein